jgi:glycosyltransferase involved in cell wall biosynthesis
MKRKRLAIISHTEHYKHPDGTIAGWGPTISEINHLAGNFEVIYHLAFLHPGSPPPSSLPYTSPNIKFVPLQPLGGKGMGAKLKLLWNMPTILKTVRKTLQQADVFQLRAPTGMGVFLIPYLTLISNKKGWYKYAGNWGQENPPLGYALQRRMLKLQKRPVTINGFWPGQPNHCHSFENPCLTEADIKAGRSVAEEKVFQPPFVFTFIGRLGEAKGVSTLLEALQQIPLEKIKSLHFVGDSEESETYKKAAAFLGDKVSFHGFLSQPGVHALLKESHFLLLPSKSEGFPKVIAEAACYGVIPVVSNVGSISHYVNHSNGFLWNPITGIGYGDLLKTVVNSSEDDLKHRSGQTTLLAEAFTFNKYLNKLNESVFRKLS